MSVPEWVQDTIFYQIFPDRFYNGNPHNDPPNVQPWGSIPTSWGFQGGDLVGILDKFDYLLDLGINAIYLNPIFEATSTHRYNTTDYYKIDPKLGTLDDFHALLNHAHKHGVKVILDGVFNHCGRGFFAFNDVLENQEFSPYRGWYHITRFPVDAYSTGEARDYLGWWGNKSLPKFNTGNPAVRKYLINIGKYWIDQGADGWRLDVPNEINDDSFWAEFRHVVKNANPDAYLMGEIWEADLRWVGDRHFDGLMNYPVVEALSGLLVTNTMDVEHFAQKVESLISYYPSENAYAMLNCLSTHDTERLLTRMGNHIGKAKLAYLFQFAYPGAPSIYYGDEIGLTGVKDPGCRGAFPWNENSWNNDMRNFIQTLVRMRTSHPALRRGEYIHIKSPDNPNFYIFVRKMSGDEVLIVMNASNTDQSTKINLTEQTWFDRTELNDLTDPYKHYEITDHAFVIKLPPWGGTWLG